MKGSRGLFILTSILIIAGTAVAAPAEVQIFPDNPGVEINHFGEYQIDITNPGTSQDTYTVTSSEHRLTVRPQQVTLEPGETSRVNAWFDPTEEMQAGTYTFPLKVTSSDGQTTSKTLSANIIKEHQTSVQAPETVTTCLSGETTVEVEVTNDGIQEETFQVISRQGSPETQQVTLQPDESRTVEITLSSDSALQETFNIISTSTSSYAQDSTEVNWNVENCYDSQLNVESEDVSGPAASTTTLEMSIENLGTREDTFNLETSYGELNTDQLTVDSGSSETFEIEVSPDQPETRQIEVTATGESQATRTIGFEAYNGMSSAVSYENSNPAVCEEYSDEEVSFSVENTGELEETFTVSTDAGNLSEDSVQLEPSESETLEQSINPAAMAGEGTSEISVTSTASTFGSPVTTATASVDLQNCWDASLNVVPEVTSVGENRSTVYEIELTNTGTRQNNYTLRKEGPDWTSIQPGSLNIQPGETRTSYLYAGAPFEKQGEVKISVIAEGTEIVEERTVTLRVDEEIRRSILNGRDLSSITGRFTESVSNLTGIEVSMPDNRILISLVLGLLLAAGVLYS